MNSLAPDEPSALAVAVLESAPDAVVVIDSAGKIHLVNRQAEILFGYSREDLLGKPVEILVPTRVRVGHPAHRRDYMNGPRTRPMGARHRTYGNASRWQRGACRYQPVAAGDG